MPQPLVTVCVPSYDDAPFLAETLTSILAQDHDDFEVLISDDASTDDTAAVVATFDDPRVRYVRHEHNVGQFENMNRCIDRATGRFVAIYHSDDVYERSIIREQLALLERQPDVGAVFTLDSWIDQEGNRLGATELPPGLPDSERLTLDDLLPVLLRHRNRVLRAPSFLARASVLAEVGRFDPERFSAEADFDYYLRLLERHPVGLIRAPLFRYRVSASQAASSYHRLRTTEQHCFAVLDRYADAADAATRVEYDFQRADDRITRAANHVILGDVESAGALARLRFPWATLRGGLTRRKVRTVLLRAAIRLSTAVGSTRPLGWILARTEYRGRRWA